MSDDNGSLRLYEIGGSLTPGRLAKAQDTASRLSKQFRDEGDFDSAHALARAAALMGVAAAERTHGFRM